MLRIGVVGQGGREHAIVKALSQSSSVDEIFAFPGNDGMGLVPRCSPLPQWEAKVERYSELEDFCLKEKLDLVIIGPEQPLVEGLSDRLRSRGICVFGPSQEAAQLEGSKIFAKKFMEAGGIPTAPYQVVHSVQEVMEAIDGPGGSEEGPCFSPPYVLKADGLASGKGVFICADREQLRLGAIDIFEKRLFEPKSGPSSSPRALLEGHILGWELSYMVITNGEDYRVLPLAQDHKRLLEGDRGPNTGGMGTVAPFFIPKELDQKIRSTIVEPTLGELGRRRLLYRGVIFLGLMIAPEAIRGEGPRPYVLEYNCRFGDPETQVILPLIQEDWAPIFLRIAQGKDPGALTPVLGTYASCVVLAAPGYPDRPRRGIHIEGDLGGDSLSYLLHGGTKRMGGSSWVTDGGRVLFSVGLGKTPSESLRLAYNRSKEVRWEGRQLRGDIGQKWLIQMGQMGSTVNSLGSVEPMKP